MNVEEALVIAKQINEKRYPHIYSTYLKAKYLANKYQIDEYKCVIGAIFHDYCKNMEIEKMRQIIRDYLDEELLQYDEETYHGFVGAFIVSHQLGIKDSDIIEGIKYHVTGSPDMNDVAKVIYIADFIEDRRTHKGVELCRKLSDLSLDLGVLGCAERTLSFLYESNNKNIHPLTLATYKSFLEKVGKDNYDIIKNNCESL